MDLNVWAWRRKKSGSLSAPRNLCQQSAALKHKSKREIIEDKPNSDTSGNNSVSSAEQLLSSIVIGVQL